MPTPSIDPQTGICQIEKKLYPAVGFGTYPLTGKTCQEAVMEAITRGYRIIDTATRYKNFDAIAKALHNKPRDLFYLISKVWHDKQTTCSVYDDVTATLKQLEVDYLDAYLVHWPNSQVPIEETLGAMDTLRCEKKIRHIGLSNVTTSHLQRALECQIPITWVQTEMHAHFFDPHLLTFCKTHGIGMQAWSPLGRGAIKEDPLLKVIGERHSKTATQIALKWIVQHGCIPIPNSSNPEHIQSNQDIYDFMLSAEEMHSIDLQAAHGTRLRPKKEHIGFQDEFDFSYAQCWPTQK